MAFLILALIPLFFILVLVYYIYCLPQEKIAAKMGHDATWMAYVPFARNAQRMRMFDMPMWKLFFVGGTFTISFSMCIIGIITWLFALIHPIAGIVIGGLLTVIYYILYIICTFSYYAIFAEEFGFDRVPTAIVMIFIPAVSQVFWFIAALSDRYYPGEYHQSQVSGNGADSNQASYDNGGYVGGYTDVYNDDPIGIMGIAGMYSGARFTMNLADEFTVGRDSTLSNVIISANGDKVSRRHCSIRFNPVTRNYEVTDFSSNGTFYGNNRLNKGQPTSVPRGSTIVIGDKSNQFRLL